MIDQGEISKVKMNIEYQLNSHTGEKHLVWKHTCFGNDKIKDVKFSESCDNIVLQKNVG